MVGRKKEINELNRLYNSNKTELVAIYGRRRIGKTFLVNENFKGRITFSHAGLSPVEHDNKGMLKKQLESFYYSLKTQGYKGNKKPKDWLEAFYLLEMFLQEIDDGSRQLVFLDELPWMDTPRSGFITAFEGFFNSWACRRNIMIIVCGSANSWILNNLINNHGGLYNRVTYEIELMPFTLKECEELYQSINVKMSRYDIAQSYMIFGGVPYYMAYFTSGLSLAQNVDNMFFQSKGKLEGEYERLFTSGFKKHEEIEKIVRFLYTKNAGFTRSEIAKELNMSDGGSLSELLNSLLASDFIIKYVPFGKGMKEHYKLIDPFCMFYLKFVKNKKMLDNNFWKYNINSQQIVSWRGFAFESICFNHIEQIKKALGISGIATTHSAWSKRCDDEDGTQIDLIISRNDNVVNMCEIKYYSDEFTVNKDYYNKLLHRKELLSKYIKKKQIIHSTLITTMGLCYNEYSGIFDNVITLDDLF